MGACSPDFFHAILDRWEELRDVIISDTVPVRPTKLYDVELMMKLQGHINYDPSFGMPFPESWSKPVCRIFTSSKVTISETAMGGGRTFMFVR